MTRKENFINALKTKTPELKISFKNESFLMKILGVIAFFNPSFMTNFVTTIGNTIYFPNREDLLLRTEKQALVTLAHEYLHVKDYQKNRLWFFFSYLFPLTCLPLMSLTLLFLPWFATLFLCALCLAPLPAIWRKKWEVRGYTMSLFVYDRIFQENGISLNDRSDELIKLAEYYNDHFINANYYFMWPFGVRNELEDKISQILSRDLQKTDVIFSDVADALVKSKEYSQA